MQQLLQELSGVLSKKQTKQILTFVGQLTLSNCRFLSSGRCSPSNMTSEQSHGLIIFSPDPCFSKLLLHVSSLCVRVHLSWVDDSRTHTRTEALSKNYKSKISAYTYLLHPCLSVKLVLSSWWWPKMSSVLFNMRALLVLDADWWGLNLLTAKKVFLSKIKTGCYGSFMVQITRCCLHHS